METLKLDVETGQGHDGLLSGLRAAEMRQVPIEFSYYNFIGCERSGMPETLARSGNWKTHSKIRAKLTLT
jgi:hypothetical protein